MVAARRGEEKTQEEAAKGTLLSNFLRTIDRSVSNLSRLGLDRRITSVRSGRHEEPGYPGGPGHGGEIDGEVRGVSTVFFPTPRIRGLEVAACSYGQSYRCGDEAANQLCRIAGHRSG